MISHSNRPGGRCAIGSREQGVEVKYAIHPVAGEAETVVMTKRSLGPGSSRGPNGLLYAGTTKMLFSDAKEAVAAITDAVKEMEEA